MNNVCDILELKVNFKDQALFCKRNFGLNKFLLDSSKIMLNNTLRILNINELFPISKKKNYFF